SPGCGGGTVDPVQRKEGTGDRQHPKSGPIESHGLVGTDLREKSGKRKAESGNEELMLKPRKLRWIILAVVIAGACGWLRLVMLPAEPIYQGLPLSAYLSSSAKNEQKAREALQQTAKEAIPFLISMFDAHDSTMRAFLARWSRKQSAIRIDL